MITEKRTWLRTFNKPYPIERLIAALTYLTAGGAGFVWLIIAAVTRKQVTPFLMYHILQSIFISILFFLISVFGNFLLVIIYKIPIINLIPVILNAPLAFANQLSIIQLFTTTIILYLAITSAMGYYSYLPWVSDIIKGNTK